MSTYNAVSSNNEIILCGDYHAAVTKPAISFDDYPTSWSNSLLHDRFIHIRIFVIVVSDEYPWSN
jgi:hypothetical protein